MVPPEDEELVRATKLRALHGGNWTSTAMLRARYNSSQAPMNSARRDDTNDAATTAVNALRPRSFRQDPSEPVDIGCGILRPIRSSEFGSILEYVHDVVHAPSRVDEKLFEFDCLVITTRSHWEFRGRAGRSGHRRAVADAGA